MTVAGVETLQRYLPLARENPIEPPVLSLTFSPYESGDKLSLNAKIFHAYRIAQKNVRTNNRFKLIVGTPEVSDYANPNLVCIHDQLVRRIKTYYIKRFRLPHSSERVVYAIRKGKKAFIGTDSFS